MSGDACFRTNEGRVHDLTTRRPPRWTAPVPRSRWLFHPGDSFGRPDRRSDRDTHATAAPTATPAPSIVAKDVLSLDEIDVEKLASALINGGWFAGRDDNEIESGNKQILLTATKSAVIVGITHDGEGNLIRIAVLDDDTFKSTESEFDLGVINGILLKETLGTESVLWQLDQMDAYDGETAIIESQAFGPTTVTVRVGEDAEYPNDAFVYFEATE